MGLNGNGSCLHSVVIRLSSFIGVTSTLNSFYATKRQPFLFLSEKCGLVRLLVVSGMRDELALNVSYVAVFHFGKLAIEPAQWFFLSVLHQAGVVALGS